MRLLICMLAVLALTVTSCGKKDTPDPANNNSGTGNNNPPTSPSSPYYFNFTFDGKETKLNANFPQYMLSDSNVIGGYQAHSASMEHFAGISFTFDHNPSDQEVRALAGKKFYFDDTDIKPEVYYLESIQANPFYSEESGDHSYYVQIDKVTYLKHEPSSLFGYGSDIYVISGTCSAVMNDYTREIILASGKFNMVISRPAP